ncbi:Fatty acid desaturase [Pseudobythopirellula maris]|uniref:Fatty acid desaturase n=1 Tax=Pseudobythopirellula maris TaxID=2527991 RepID=A0A5C5ZMR4_9BACT|nr:fatty acid desaturase [Pseudobythopirellula maris]TWT88151.1 Fatty acid desaturase [Pseudobythopirellula maris]
MNRIAEAKPPKPAAGVAPSAPHGDFSLAQARSIVGEYFRPNPWVYWTDFLLSWAVAMFAFKAVQFTSIGWPARIGCFFLSSLLIYRCGLFIHELMHIPEKEFKAFRFVWNLLAGIPFLIPTFVYQTHVDHHRRKHYGTEHDGEYLPLSHRSPWHIVAYLAQSFVIPILAIVRFGVLTPLTWFNTPLRDWVHRHASSMIIDPMYLRPLPTKKALRAIRWQELGCFLFICVMGFGSWRGLHGAGNLGPYFLPQAYLTGVFVVTVNALRTLGAHRWLNDSDKKDEAQMTFVEQMLDSVNYPTAGSLAPVWAPMGLRFHALHHIFPSMPYHALAKAHKRLMRDLPSDSPYRQTNSDSLLAELGELWRRAAASQKG